MINFFKGLNYNNEFIYNGLTFLKLLNNYDLRFKIAQQFVSKGDSVLDVCSGAGRLKKFLPENCSYDCIDASDAFNRALFKKGVCFSSQNLNEGLKLREGKYDIAFMLISLCHFRGEVLANLLKTLKSSARKIIIIEDVLKDKRMNNTLKRRVMNYLCRVSYSDFLELFSFDEFKESLRNFDYSVTKYNERYAVATFGI